MFSNMAKSLPLTFGGHCLREVFQTLRDYNLARGLAFILGFMTLTLFQGYRYIRILQIVFRLPFTVV